MYLIYRRKRQFIKYLQQSGGYVVLLCEADTKVSSATASKNNYKRQRKILWDQKQGIEISM